MPIKRKRPSIKRVTPVILPELQPTEDDRVDILVPLRSLEEPEDPSGYVNDDNDDNDDKTK
jgi:hypothetical protein